MHRRLYRLPFDQAFTDAVKKQDGRGNITRYTGRYFFIVARKGALELRTVRSMVYIVTTNWSGLQGGPGITQMAMEIIGGGGGFIDDATADIMVDAVAAFWNSIKSEIPNDVTLTVSGEVPMFATANGELGPIYNSASPPAAIVGGSALAYSAASGYKINVRTGDVKNNRRVRGSIFVVPSSINVYDNNGNVSSSVATAVATAQATLRTTLAGPNIALGVWSRPKGSPVASGGTFHETTGLDVSTKVAVLRGRRDG